MSQDILMWSVTQLHWRKASDQNFYQRIESLRDKTYDTHCLYVYLRSFIVDLYWVLLSMCTQTITRYHFSLSLYRRALSSCDGLWHFKNFLLCFSIIQVERMLWPIACRDYRINYYEWTVSHRSIDICMYSYICCINCFFWTACIMSLCAGWRTRSDLTRQKQHATVCAATRPVGLWYDVTHWGNSV